jgi:hypothetical protein
MQKEKKHKGWKYSKKRCRRGRYNSIAGGVKNILGRWGIW